MAEALLAEFLTQMGTVIHDLAEHELKLVTGVNDALENLKRNIQAIKLVIDEAEKRQWKDDAVKLWIDDLKDLCYDMDHVLDEWNTAILKSEIGGAAVESVSLGRKLKVRLSALCRCFRSGPLVGVVRRRGIASKIEHLNSRLDGISSRKDKFGFSSVLSSRIDNPIRSNTTTSFVDVSKVFGQESYKRNLMDRLWSEGGSSGRDLQIIPVVGMGGIGKTTLAKVVFNDDKVKGHFSKRLIWVCVSEPFDIVKIVTAIVQQLTGEAPPSGELEVLMQSLIASIQDKKFLLVLDDVWTDDYQKWEPLERHLLHGGVGSRVIVTTRKVEVVRMMGVSESSMIRVKELSETDSWLVFGEIAFFGKSEEERRELEEIGREVTLKCNGLPLAAKTLGSLLRLKKTKQEWLDVLQSEIWRLEKVQENLFHPLLLSYFDLSPTEKRCFSYCAIFAKDVEINKDRLVLMWMAQGYFDADGFNAGERCFENLAMRSFFQDFYYAWEGNIAKCKMHDIVHDFVLFLTRSEHWSLVINNLREKVTLNTRHLTVIVPSEHQSQPSDPLQISSKKNVQSLIFCGPEIAHKSVIDWCSRFTSLRTLSLTSKIKTNLVCIGDLVHLRLLELICTENDGDGGRRELPRTLGNLINLQSLILQGFSVPKHVSKLINLRNLHCSYLDEFEFVSLPKGIVKLKHLQSIHVALCPSSDVDVKDKFEIGDLGDLNNLRILAIQNLGVDEGHVSGAMRAQLSRKTDLVKLLLWFYHASVADFETHKNTLEALQPPPNLTFLMIINYGPSFIAPAWTSSLSLTHLKSLFLINLFNCETLPPLGKLQSLEILMIVNIIRVSKIGPEFLGVNSNTLEQDPTAILFPKLKSLNFSSMPSWSEWVGIQVTAVKIMPCLEKLGFERCDELESLPDFLEKTPLLELIINASPKLESVCQEDIGKEWSKIRHVPNVKFFHGLLPIVDSLTAQITGDSVKH